MKVLRNSLAVQWLGLSTSTAEGPGLIPGQGNKIPQATWHSQKRERERKFLKYKFYQFLPMTYEV